MGIGSPIISNLEKESSKKNPSGYTPISKGSKGGIMMK
jgi:hypothetical protein